LKLIQPELMALHDFYRARHVLIRPDQHVAWRGDEVPENLPDLWRRVTGHATS
jgi:hypothetical protein